ncbi:MAG: O-antigen ligase family protein [Lachnospiraceae bacterium]|nr:O-antigen ligase family protein [Lachnospiraceae bacterium]
MSSKKKKASEPEQSVAQQIVDFGMSMLMLIYVSSMLVFYPLYYQHKYLDMGDAKYGFFRNISITFLIFFLIILASWILAYRDKLKLSSILGKFSTTDWFATAFLVLSYLSYMFSEYQKPVPGDTSSALVGYNGWYMGLLSQVMFVLIFFAVSRFWSWSEFTLFSAIVTSGVVYQIAILQRFSIDPLEMYDGLGPEYIEKFLSTLGQSTWFSSYAVLAFPLAVYYFWHDDRRWVRILVGIVVALGFGSLCTAHSDSGYVAYVLILMVFFWFSLESNKKFARFLEIVLVGLASFRIIGIMQLCFPEKLIQLIAEDQKISFFITQSNFMMAMLLIVAAIYIVYYLFCSSSWKEVKKTEKGKKGQESGAATANKQKFEISRFLWLRKLMIIAAAAVLLGVVLVIVFTTKKMLPDALAGFYNVGFFNFNDTWGNCRGFNWRMSLHAIANASFKDMLIGVGPDCFAMSMDKYCAQEVAVFWQGMKLACAHNEFLNMLVTQGILGVTAYVGIFVSFIVRCIKNGKGTMAVVPFAAAALAYMGHNFFCYQQCICTPMVFLLMGIGELLMRNETQSKEKD